MEAERAKDILSFVSQLYQESRHPRQFSKIIEEPIDLFIVEKEDRNLCYLTDGYYTILGLAAGKKEVFHRCNNLLPTRYYIYQEKTYLYLNFTGEHPQPEPQKMHPYTPHFYLKEHFKRFLQVRPQLALSNPCELLRLTKWQLDLVNINSVGYYAPAIIIHDFKRSLSNSPPKYLGLNCILFEPFVQKIMEEYRLIDFREEFSKKLPKIVGTSLFYLARRLTLNTGRVENNSIVLIDRNKKDILAYRGTTPSLILCSDYLEGICSIASPARQEINQEQMERIQFKHLDDLFNGLALSVEKLEMLEQKKKDEQRIKEEKEMMKKQKRDELWSDSSSERGEDNEEGGESRTAEEAMVAEQVNDSDSEEQDPLKVLYKRQMNKKS